MDPSQRYKIIAADDEAPIRDVFQKYIDLAGKEDMALLSIVSDGGTLVELAKYIPAFDLIVTDNEMPGMDGIEAIRELRKLHFKQPAIIATGRYQRLVDSEPQDTYRYPAFDNPHSHLPGMYAHLRDDPLTRVIEKPYGGKEIIKFMRELRDGKLPDQIFEKLAKR
ncbi:MAG: response regulator [Nanoarchaeota archaeon]|nr:response regulator [Nanoarchaeota archaeon]